MVDYISDSSLKLFDIYSLFFDKNANLQTFELILGLMWDTLIVDFLLSSNTKNTEQQTKLEHIQVIFLLRLDSSDIFSWNNGENVFFF